VTVFIFFRVDACEVNEVVDGQEVAFDLAPSYRTGPANGEGVKVGGSICGGWRGIVIYRRVSQSGGCTRGPLSRLLAVELRPPIIVFCHLALNCAEFVSNSSRSACFARVPQACEGRCTRLLLRMKSRDCDCNVKLLCSRGGRLHLQISTDARF